MPATGSTPRPYPRQSHGEHIQPEAAQEQEQQQATPGSAVGIDGCRGRPAPAGASHPRAPAGNRRPQANAKVLTSREADTTVSWAGPDIGSMGSWRASGTRAGESARAAAAAPSDLRHAVTAEIGKWHKLSCTDGREGHPENGALSVRRGLRTLPPPASFAISSSRPASAIPDTARV